MTVRLFLSMFKIGQDGNFYDTRGDIFLRNSSKNIPLHIKLFDDQSNAFFLY